MAEHENSKKHYQPRRNPSSRQPPGIQKALHNFGVTDLREILDKKHQEQGDLQENDVKQKLPPPDPSYNYLRDPARDQPRPPPKKAESKQSHSFKEFNSSRNRNIYRSNTDQQGDTVHQSPRKVAFREPQSEQESSIGKVSLSTDDLIHTNNDSHVHRSHSGGRSSFRGRKTRRGNAEFNDEKFERIDNPINIKGELSTETGESLSTDDINYTNNESRVQRAQGESRSSVRGRKPRRGNVGGYHDERFEASDNPINIKGESSTETRKSLSTNYLNHTNNESHMQRPQSGNRSSYGGRKPRKGNGGYNDEQLEGIDKSIGIKVELSTETGEPLSTDDLNQTDESHIQRSQGGSRSSYRGRKPRRENSGYNDGPFEGINNPVNIKVELSTETGQRNCIMDESTKISDIKHVPDHPLYHRNRGRGGFRGRGRGRGSFRGRGGKYNGKANSEHYNDLPEKDAWDESLQNQESPDKNAEHTTFTEDNGNGEPDNNNQDDVDEWNVSFETSPELVEEEQDASAFDGNSPEIITVTSSEIQDGDVKRYVEVKSSAEEKLTDSNQDAKI